MPAHAGADIGAGVGMRGVEAMGWSRTRIMWCVLPLAASLVLLAAAPAANAGPWSFSKHDIRFLKKYDLVPKSALRRGANGKVTRREFLAALSRLERWRAQHHGGTVRLTSIEQGAKLKDVKRTSLAARAVKLGWFAPRKGRFAGGGNVSANDAALGVVGALGLNRDARSFANRLRREIPRAKTNYRLKAVHVMVRSMGLRYNHLSGSEHLEVHPNRPMKLGHLAYMLRRAAGASDWELGGARGYASFDLPKLRTNEMKMARRALRLVGTPYVWAGNVEQNTRSQPQRMGGFDCSGFVRRIYDSSGVPRRKKLRFVERTSMDMSAIPKKRRLNRKKIRPADVLFWGYDGRRSKPKDNFHAGLYLGNGWFIHSSGGNGGVSIDRLDGYWADTFSWGRRVVRR